MDDSWVTIFSTAGRRNPDLWSVAEGLNTLRFEARVTDFGVGAACGEFLQVRGASAERVALTILDRISPLEGDDEPEWVGIAHIIAFEVMPKVRVRVPGGDRCRFISVSGPDAPNFSHVEGCGWIEVPCHQVEKAIEWMKQHRGEWFEKDR